MVSLGETRAGVHTQGNGLGVRHACAMTRPRGKRVAVALEPYRLLWLEEPLAAGRYRRDGDIRHATNYAGSCGENLYLRWGIPNCCRSVRPTSSCRYFKRSAAFRRRAKIPIWLRPYYVPFGTALASFLPSAPWLRPTFASRSQLPGLRVALDQPFWRLETFVKRANIIKG